MNLESCEREILSDGRCPWCGEEQEADLPRLASMLLFAGTLAITAVWTYGLIAVGHWILRVT
jgi:hypothetical protein